MQRTHRVEQDKLGTPKGDKTWQVPGKGRVPRKGTIRSLLSLCSHNLADRVAMLVSAHFGKVIHMGKATVMHTGYEKQASSQLRLWTTAQSADVC